jgi:poly-beta-1,6-N-acetyl-D-glucosamine synthase
MAPMLLAIAVLLFVYPFVIYPVLLPLLVRRKENPGEAPAGHPTVALVICALNEETIIRQKLENSLSLEYPEGKLRIVLVSDGSTDRTAEIAREYAGGRLQLVENAARRGKVSNLNQVVLALQEEVVAFSDANVLYESDAILRLVARLADPAVGCVSGKVVLTDTTGDLSRSEEQYYSMEWTLQERESQLYSMVGADGAMYLLRRHLFRACPGDTVIEDLVIPMAVVRQGFRVVFEPRARAREKGVTSVREEFRRRTRIAAGAAQSLIRGNGWPGRAPAVFWFIFISHKLLRWLAPLVGLAALLLALASLDAVLSRLVVAGVAVLALAAGLRYVTGVSNRVLDAAFYFLCGQIASLWGLIKGAAGRQSVLWVKANR